MRRWLLTAAAISVVGLLCAVWVSADGGLWLPVTLVAAGAWLAMALTGWSLLAVSANELTTARAQLASQQAEITRFQTRLTEISNAQGRFVGNIAHEIKTPLVIALVQLDLLLRCSNNPIKVRLHAKSIAEDIRHLSDLVDSFLRLARPFSQADTSHHVPVDVHDFVVDAASRSQTLAREGGVRIVLKLAETAIGQDAPEVLGEAVLLEAMLENLVRNAVRFAPRGSPVELDVNLRGEEVLLTVRDHGAGIAVDDLESVFDWFFSAPGLTLPSAGTGFGLAIAQRIAEHHRGHISIENRATGGCKFEITLPRWRAEDLPASGEATPVPSPALIPADGQMTAPVADRTPSGGRKRDRHHDTNGNEPPHILVTLHAPLIGSSRSDGKHGAPGFAADGRGSHLRTATPS